MYNGDGWAISSGESCAHVRFDPRFCYKLTHDGISNWLYVVYSLFDFKFGSRFNIDGDGYDDVVTHDRIIAF